MDDEIYDNTVFLLLGFPFPQWPVACLLLGCHYDEVCCCCCCRRLFKFTNTLVVLLMPCVSLNSLFACLTALLVISLSLSVWTTAAATLLVRLLVCY